MSDISRSRLCSLSSTFSNFPFEVAQTQANAIVTTITLVKEVGLGLLAVSVRVAFDLLSPDAVENDSATALSKASNSFRVD